MTLRKTIVIVESLVHIFTITADNFFETSQGKNEAVHKNRVFHSNKQTCHLVIQTIEA